MTNTNITYTNINKLKKGRKLKIKPFNYCYDCMVFEQFTYFSNLNNLLITNCSKFFFDILRIMPSMYMKNMFVVVAILQHIRQLTHSFANYKRKALV